jgi:hypothetical protein
MTTLLSFAKTIYMSMNRKFLFVMALVSSLRLFADDIVKPQEVPNVVPPEVAAQAAAAKAAAEAADHPKQEGGPDSTVPSVPIKKIKRFSIRGETCPKKHLLIKDCYFQMDKTRVQVWKSKIFLNNLIDRDTKKLPFEAEIEKNAVDWDFMRSSQLHGRWFLELGIWGPPQGVGEVESLIWSVYEIEKSGLLKRLEKVIQKRKKWELVKNNMSKVANIGKETNLSKDKKKSSPEKYKMDKIASFGLKLSKKVADNVDPSKFMDSKLTILWTVNNEKGSF